MVEKQEVFTDLDPDTGEIVTGSSEKQLQTRLRAKRFGESLRREKEGKEF